MAQDEDLIVECEWLVGIYRSRKAQEMGTYGWQSCDEIKDPESGRRADAVAANSDLFPYYLWGCNVKIM